MSTRYSSVFAVLAACAFVGCARDEAGDRDTIGVDTTTAAATPTTPALSDANIAALLDEANVADSSHGHLASTKATNAEVKEFAKRMMADHHNLRQQGIDLAAKLNITPEPPSGNTLAADAKAWHDSLTSMPKGAAWDKAYIDHEVTMHENVLKTIDDALSATQTAELRTLLEGARGGVQGHLELARSLQSKLGSGTQ